MPDLSLTLVYSVGNANETPKMAHSMANLPMTGDPLPWIDIPTTREATLPLDRLAGQVLVITVLASRVNIRSLLEEIEASAACLKAKSAFWLVLAGTILPSDSLQNPHARLVPDPDGKVAEALQVDANDERSSTHWTDRGLRLIDRIEHSGSPDIRWILKKAAANQPELDAPVIMIPNVLASELRAQLITAWCEGDKADTGYLRNDPDGSLVHVVNPGRKRRVDHFLDDANPLVHEIHACIRQRVVPWIDRATHFRIGFAERYRIACYDAGAGGFFSPHRDFLGPNSHRHFAMTIALNDDFRGGGLRFPEFGSREYRPRPGEAIVYSGTLLHEVTRVTGGRRFALVNFLTDGTGKKAVARYQGEHGEIPRVQKAHMA